jgi:hypothetical protein
MQIVTLTQVKFQLRITHAALDTGLTDLTERKEREILQYLGFVNRDAFLDHFTMSTDTDTEIAEQSMAAVQSAVLIAVDTEFNDSTKSWRDNTTIRQLLLPYRMPALSMGSTE